MGTLFETSELVPSTRRSSHKAWQVADRGDSHLSIARRCQLLKVARSTLYYRPAPVSDDDLALMRRLDEQYLVTPFYGARRMAAVLRRDGLVVNRNEPQADTPTDTGDGDRGHLPEAEHQSPASASPQTPASRRNSSSSTPSSFRSRRAAIRPAPTVISSACTR